MYSDALNLFRWQNKNQYIYTTFQDCFLQTLLIQQQKAGSECSGVSYEAINKIFSGYLIKNDSFYSLNVCGE